MSAISTVVVAPGVSLSPVIAKHDSSDVGTVATDDHRSHPAASASHVAGPAVWDIMPPAPAQPAKSPYVDSYPLPSSNKISGRDKARVKRKVERLSERDNRDAGSHDGSTNLSSADMVDGLGDLVKRMVG